MKHYGALGGGQAGFNWQSGMWLSGIETDMQFAHQRTATVSGCPGTICNPGIPFEAPVAVIHQHNLDWFGTVRGRLGATITPNAVAYVTGGLAYGEVEHAGAILGTGFDDMGNAVSAGNNFFSRQLRAGWTAGGGIEARLAGNVTGKIEYLHVDFGSDTAPAASPLNGRPIALDFHSRINEDLIRLGINYKFDPNAVVATYQAAIPDKPRMIFKSTRPAPWTWTGYYLGLNGGYSWGKSRTDALFNDSSLGTAFATSSSFGIDGKVFGIQTGYNFQAGGWVWGIEADAQLTAQHADPKFTCPDGVCNPAGPVLAAFDQSQKVQWFATLRARLGATITPNAIVYLTGGAAVADLRTEGTVFGFDVTGAPLFNSFGNITINAGWTIGGGIEARLCGNWTGKVEYLYLNLGSMSTNLNNQESMMALTTTFNSRVTDRIVRAGVNYKFD